MSVVLTTTDKGLTISSLIQSYLLELLIVLVIHPCSAAHDDRLGECHVSRALHGIFEQKNVVVGREYFPVVRHLLINREH